MRRVGHDAGCARPRSRTRLLIVADPPVVARARPSAALIHHAPLLPPPLDRAATRSCARSTAPSGRSSTSARRTRPSDDDLLGLLLRARDEDGGLPHARVRDEATTFMLAGHETTANALAWMWYLLALNVEARERMLAEVDEVLGGRRPTVDDLAALPWTTACFQEAMRFFPPAWVIPRVCVRDDEIDGHRIPKGATVLIPSTRIHHDARFWPEPEASTRRASCPRTRAGTTARRTCRSAAGGASASARASR